MARVVITRDADETLRLARIKRDQLLKDSDWTQMLDNRLTAEQREAWALVREEWRAVTDDIAAGIPPRPWAAPPEF